jgi:hypothetical protein
MNRGNYSKTNTRGVLNTTQNTAVVVVLVLVYRCYRPCVQVCPTISTQYIAITGVTQAVQYAMFSTPVQEY